jgi:TPP-dependent 2-oxoacid decarboxylase
MVLQEVLFSSIAASFIAQNRGAAFSEMVPVLHVVGVPSTAQQKSKPMLHHTLGDGRYIFAPSTLFSVYVA